MGFYSQLSASQVLGTQVLGVGPLPLPRLGPHKQRVMLIGEFPGIDEGRRATPFIGKSGQELRRFLNGYTLPRAEDLYLTNLSKTVTATVADFTFTEDDDLILWGEIAAAEPTTIVTLGSHATKYFLGDVSLDAVHGLIHEVYFCAEALDNRTHYPLLDTSRQGTRVLDVHGRPTSDIRLRSTQFPGIWGGESPSVQLRAGEGADPAGARRSPHVQEPRVRQPGASGDRPSTTSQGAGVVEGDNMQTGAPSHARKPVSEAQRSAMQTVSARVESGVQACPSCGGALTKIALMPCYNPAAMLHSPNLQAVFAYCMHRLSAHLKGTLPASPKDTHLPGRYNLVDHHPHLLVLHPLLGIDTEGWKHRPWGASWSHTAGSGDVARTGSPGWRKFRDNVASRKPTLIFHNSLHDLDVLAAMDPPLDVDALEIPYEDTMVMAYLLGLEPQGLKTLAYRHAGMAMQDYADLTREAQTARTIEWLLALLARLPNPKPKALSKKALAALPQAAQTQYIADLQTAEMFPDLAKAATLITRMLNKEDDDGEQALDTLTKRWEDSRAREILVEDTEFLDPYHADPGEPSLDEIPLADAVYYAGRDPDATKRIYPILRKNIDAMGLTDVYETDRRIIPMVARMQHVGLGVDLAHFKDLEGFLEDLRAINLETIEGTVGRPVNPNSGDQVAALLYEELRLDVLGARKNIRIKRTKGGRYSTNDKTLDALALLHPIVPLIQEGRGLSKLLGTYVRPMPSLVSADGRLHPNYRITRTDTGRLAAGNPNVLAFPKRDTLGKYVRDGIVAGEGREFGEWDLSQIEMCVFASDSGDETMCRYIIDGVDLHRATAGQIFGIAPDAVSKDQRFAAKAVNFGILMGITEFGLLDQFHKNGQLHYTLDDTTRLLVEWGKVYPGGKDYIETKHAEARRYGYVRDMWGRLRYLEGIRSDDDYIRKEAERMAQSTPTQSGAQGIMKRIMGAVWPVLRAWREDFWIEPLLQIHDALMLEYEAGRREEIHELMIAAMTSTVEIKVPIRAEATFGQRWGEL